MEENMTASIEQRVNLLESEMDILRTQIKVLEARLALEKAQSMITVTHIQERDSKVWPARIRALLRF